LAQAIPPERMRKLERAGYRFLGRLGHGAVKICHWTKSSLLDRGACYKEAFYGNLFGVRSHRCLQLTPALPFCDHRCVFCWRDTDLTSPSWTGGADDPRDILNDAIKAQRILLSGFGGNPEVNREKFREAMNPSHCAISLAGEPTLCPGINGLIEECKKRGMTTFLVTNGQHPEVLENLERPTQLYISVVAPDEETYLRVCRPVGMDGWEKLTRSLSLMKTLDCRRAIRLTMVRGMNMVNPEGYARLVELAEPDHLEVKAYMFVGFSRKRMTMDNMPSHAEIAEFAKKLADLTGYSIACESEASRAILLKK